MVTTMMKVTVAAITPEAKATKHMKIMRGPVEIKA